MGLCLPKDATVTEYVLLQLLVFLVFFVVGDATLPLNADQNGLLTCLLTYNNTKYS